MKKFNTAGPSVLQRHFMIDPLQRIDVQEIEDLIEDHRYFVLHAPRQTGKTTFLMQAFLQRMVNGGDRINREYGLGLKRTDLFIEWPIDEAQGFYGPVQRIVVFDRRPEVSWEERIWQREATQGAWSIMLWGA